jgi:hypothetical protein
MHRNVPLLFKVVPVGLFPLRPDADNSPSANLSNPLETITSCSSPPPSKDELLFSLSSTRFMSTVNTSSGSKSVSAEDGPVRSPDVNSPCNSYRTHPSHHTLKYHMLSELAFAGGNISTASMSQGGADMFLAMVTGDGDGSLVVLAVLASYGKVEGVRVQT